MREIRICLMLGSTDKTMGQLSLAWKAIHIGLPM